MRILILLELPSRFIVAEEEQERKWGRRWKRIISSSTSSSLEEVVIPIQCKSVAAPAALLFHRDKDNNWGVEVAVTQLCRRHRCWWLSRKKNIIKFYLGRVRKKKRRASLDRDLFTNGKKFKSADCAHSRPLSNFLYFAFDGSLSN